MKSHHTKDITPQLLQQYLQSSIAPRPVALVSTINAKGEVNLSPFSFFNLFSIDPPVCVFSPSRRMRDNTTKHTLDNLQDVPECVIHVVTESMVHQTSLASAEYEQGVNEFLKAGFTPVKSDEVRPPRVAESPVHMECRVQQIIPLGTGPGAGNLVVAEIIRLHISEDILDKDSNRIDQLKLDLVARLGDDWYARMNRENLFRVPKPVTGTGIGFDELPLSVRNSTVLSGNDLARLAGCDELPGDEEVDLYVTANPVLMKTIRRLQDDKPMLQQFIHNRAKELVSRNACREAWLVLMAGIYHSNHMLENHPTFD